MGISAKPSVFAEPGLEADKRNRNAVVKYLGPLLGSAKKPARLYYFETCEANDSDPLAFPRLRVRPPSNGKKGLDAVASTFGGLVLYGECASRSGRHFFRVDWVELRGTENRPD
jgi:hypothetical protein